MRRREFIKLAGGAAVAWPVVARAQQPAMSVIGFVHSETPAAIPPEVAAFQRGLSEAGYIEGRNVTVEYRWAEGQFDRVPALVADLVRRDVALIVAGGGTIAAVKAAGTGIPTVFTTGSDPVQAGLVSSLSRPDGNMTGVAFFVTTMGPKKLEALLAAVPSAKVIGLASDPDYPWLKDEIDELEVAVRAFGRKLVKQNIANDAQIEAAFVAFAQQGVDSEGNPFSTAGASGWLRKRTAMPCLLATLGVNS